MYDSVLLTVLTLLSRTQRRDIICVSTSVPVLQRPSTYRNTSVRVCIRASTYRKREQKLQRLAASSRHVKSACNPATVFTRIDGMRRLISKLPPIHPFAVSLDPSVRTRIFCLPSLKRYPGRKFRFYVFEGIREQRGLKCLHLLCEIVDVNIIKYIYV